VTTAGKGLVLVVEDEPAIAQLERMYLQREGFGVQVATDGHAALLAVRNLRPVAVVLDVGLPGLDGTQVCQAMRAADDWTPVQRRPPAARRDRGRRAPRAWGRHGCR